MQIPRNASCPCGSGKKYKQCCLTALDTLVTETEPKPYDGAASKVLAWLFMHHRKGMQVALDHLLAQLLTPQEINSLAKEDSQTLTSVDINLTEWLLAQGSILVKGAQRKIVDYVLSEDAALLNLLTLEQRLWITQLSIQPLRLYDVTDVIPGVQMTLCDALNFEAAPVVVQERSGTRSLEPGMHLGCRIMKVQDHLELSGCVYLFSRIAVDSVTQAYDTYLEQASKHSEQTKQVELSLIIACQWLRQFVAPLSMPKLVDAQTGDPMLFTTDHYLVNNWETLTKQLAKDSDIEGDINSGWSRLQELLDGQVRPIASFEPNLQKNQLAVFYKTQKYADQGRIWFEGLMGNAVKFRIRELIDPMSSAPKPQKPSRKVSKLAKSKPGPMDALSSKDLAQLMEKAIRQIYLNWADKPIPALDNQTPRQAMNTAAGLERVKGLIRSYEAGEEMQAEQQEREPISYDFLWESLGLER
jgi:hypothetical protein